MDKFKVTYGDEVTEQLFSAVGQEIVDGVECRIIKFSYCPPASPDYW